jgi:hypothetical protein
LTSTTPEKTFHRNKGKYHKRKITSNEVKILRKGDRLKHVLADLPLILIHLVPEIDKCML